MTEELRPMHSPEYLPGAPAGVAGTYAQHAVDSGDVLPGEDIAPAYRTSAPAQPSVMPPLNESDTSTTGVAKEQAGQVADTAKQAGTQVAGAVKEQAAEVTAEAGRQVKQLLSQTQSELTDQAGATQQRVSEGLHALADELAGMAQNSNQDGPATDLARQAADKAHQAAGWLADRDPGALLDEIRSFARRKPGTYLAIALGAGVLAGRLTRGLTAPEEDRSISTAKYSGPATGLTSSGNARLVDDEPLRALGSTSPALDAGLPETSVTLGGLGATGALNGQRGEVAP
jgi:gas vesicle protein